MNTMRYLMIGISLAFSNCLVSNASEIIRIKISFGALALEQKKVEVYINGTCDKSQSDNNFNLSTRVMFKDGERTIYIENTTDLVLCLDEIEKKKVSSNWSTNGFFSVRRFGDVYELRQNSGGNAWILKLSSMQAQVLKEKINKMLTTYKNFTVELDQ